LFESSGEEDFQFLLDPFTGKIVLVAPAPMVAFDDLQSFDEFVEMLNKVSDTLNNEISKDRDKPIVRRTKIDSNYAKEVIDAWQNQMINKNSQELGPEKQGNEPENSTSQDKP
jgi:hypothetical protein